MGRWRATSAHDSPSSAAGEHRAGVRAEVDPGGLAPVAAHPLTEHREEARLLGQAGPQRLPRRTGVARAPHRRGGIRRVPTLGVAVERQGPDRPASRGCAHSGNPKVDGQARGDVVPAEPPVGRAPDPVVVLLVEHVAVADGPLDVVHAEPGVTIGCRRGVCVPLTVAGVGEVVAPLPGHATVLRGEDPRGGDAHPQLLRVLGVGDDGVQHEPGGARAPLGGRRVVGQPLDGLPRRAVVVADEQGRRLGAGVEPGADPRQGPHLGEAVTERCRRLRPADRRGEGRVVGGPRVHLSRGQLAELPGASPVVGAPDPGAGPVAAAPGPDRAADRVADDVVDRPPVAVRPADGPAAALGIAVEHEGTLGRAHQQVDGSLGHRQVPPRDSSTLRGAGRSDPVFRPGRGPARPRRRRARRAAASDAAGSAVRPAALAGRLPA